MKSLTTHVEEAAQWSLRLADGEAEEDAFQAWLDADIENRRAYEELSATLAGLENFAGAPEMVSLRGQAMVAARRSHDLLRAKAFFSSRLGLAASIAVLAVSLIAGGVWWRWQSHTFVTGVGERRAFVLVDGSRLTLDAASRVDVDYSAERRRLSLARGRARFDVAKDALRPFTVESGGQLVVATGTSFSVERVKKQVHVVLYEGRVEVLPVHGERNKPLLLQPGQELVAADNASRKTVSIAAVDTTRAVAWESGELAFADEPLGLAVERVNRYASRHLKVGDAAAAQVRISGVFHAGDTATFVDGVTALFPVRAEHAGDAVTFVIKK